jgi:hypothetical protein
MHAASAKLYYMKGMPHRANLGAALQKVIFVG